MTERKLNLKERIDRLPLQMQLDLMEDMHTAIESRLIVFEKDFVSLNAMHQIMLREECEMFERKQYTKESRIAMQEAFPNLELPKRRP